jgi:hypothetical protein
MLIVCSDKTLEAESDRGGSLQSHGFKPYIGDGDVSKLLWSDGASVSIKYTHGNGTVIHFANNYSAAAELIQNHRFQTVFLEYEPSPGKDGLQFALDMVNPPTGRPFDPVVYCIGVHNTMFQKIILHQTGMAGGQDWITALEGSLIDQVRRHAHTYRKPMAAYAISAVGAQPGCVPQ